MEEGNREEAKGREDREEGRRRAAVQRCEACHCKEAWILTAQWVTCKMIYKCVLTWTQFDIIHVCVSACASAGCLCVCITSSPVELGVSRSVAI